MSTSFADILASTDIGAELTQGTDYSWERIRPRLAWEELTLREFAAIIVDDDDAHLEELAQAARIVRTQRFGNAIKIYAPVYISNACINGCRYCGFNARHDIPRSTLSVQEAMREADVLIDQGHRHLLLVSGEDDAACNMQHIAAIARAVRPRIASLAIEVRPMALEEYRILASAGIDGVTLYQETYQREVYHAMHAFGPKAHYENRLAACEAAGEAGMRFLGIGALLGLTDWRSEILAVYAHARYLMKRFWRSHITISLPRLRAVPDGFDIPHPVGDRELVRMIVALRCALPDAGIIVSTREPAALRNRLVPLGITQMSAGSRTNPGGYAQNCSAGTQFSVEDIRSPAEVADALRDAGFDPVFKDWENCLH